MLTRMIASIATLLLAAVGLTLMFAGQAGAQTFPCPNGPGPGQRQVGAIPSGAPGANVPLCIDDAGGQPGNGGGQPRIPAGKAKVWGAAVRGGDGRIQVAYQYVSKKTALDAATGACMAKPANAGRCTTLAADIGVFAVARGGDGQDYFGSKTIDIDAAKIAMSECRKKAKNCQLIATVDTVSGPRDPSVVLPFVND